MDKDLEFKQALQEFFANGGQVEMLPYHGPKFINRVSRAPMYIPRY